MKATMLSAALAYAKLGWHVFPVNTNKTPLTPNGHLNASDNPKIIRQLWEKYPDANIAVSVGPSNLVVLDIDNKGREGNPFERLVEKVGPFDSSVSAKTGNDGHHLFFQAEPHSTLRSLTRFMGIPNIDIRAGSGYVVVSPSRITRLDATQGAYTWIQSPFDYPLLPVPEFLTSQRTITLELGPVIEGHRNMFLTSAAGHLRAGGLSGASLYTALQEVNQRRCSPPLEDREVQAIVKSMHSYPDFPTNRPSMDVEEEEGDSEEGPTAVDPVLDMPFLEDVLAYEYTDKGLSRMLAHVLGEKVRYNHSRGKWNLWQGHWWAPDEREEIIQLGLGVTDLYTRAIAFLETDEQQGQAYRWARTIANKARLASGFDFMKSHPVVSTIESEWNKDPNVFAVSNGVVELQTGTMRPGRMEDYINSWSPVTYDAQAQCPRWNQFLDEVFLGDEELKEFIQTSVGYTLTGHNREQCLFLLVGNGANGKSVFLDTLHYLLGSYGHAAPFTTFIRSSMASERTLNDIALLAGKRFAVASEANEGVAFDTARLKTLTGGERIAARFLYQEYFEFEPFVRIWLGVNHLPGVRDDSDGFWRRVYRVNFNRKFRPEEQDKDLKEVLRQEAPGILLWAIEGAVRWYKQGLQVPDSVRHATTVYRIDSDPLAPFLNELCEVGSGLEVEESILYPQYLAFMMNRKAKPHEILAASKFHQHLRMKFRRPLDNDPSDQRKVYLGLALVKQAAPNVSIIRQNGREGKGKKHG